jgi:hypothetical protein
VLGGLGDWHSVYGATTPYSELLFCRCKQTKAIAMAIPTAGKVEIPIGSCLWRWFLEVLVKIGGQFPAVRPRGCVDWIVTQSLKKSKRRVSLVS